MLLMVTIFCTKLSYVVFFHHGCLVKCFQRLIFIFLMSVSLKLLFSSSEFSLSFLSSLDLTVMHIFFRFLISLKYTNSLYNILLETHSANSRIHMLLCQSSWNILMCLIASTSISQTHRWFKSYIAFGYQHMTCSTTKSFPEWGGSRSNQIRAVAVAHLCPAQ